MMLGASMTAAATTLSLIVTAMLTPRAGGTPREKEEKQNKEH